MSATGTPRLTATQRDALLHAPMLSRFGRGRLVMSSRSSAVNVRTARKLAEYGLIELHEGYSRQDGGNVWTAALTARGEVVRDAIRQEMTS